MGSPAIFSGKRTKLLSTKGILNSDTSIIDNDGVLNYIKNGHAEVNALGWATYADAAGVLPVDGTGGTPTHITFTQTTTAPLGGLGSFLVTNSGSTSAQGEGASYDFTIDAKDKAKVLQINFDYLVNSGTFVAGSTGVDSDLEVYIYDVTNALVIQPSSYKLLSNNTTLTDKFSATFQTASNSTSYRLILHCPTTATAAWSIKLDNVMVSPSQYVYGSPVTDWVSYTPTTTGFGTSSSVQFSSRRVGGNLEVVGRLTPGALSAVTVQITLGYNGGNGNVTVNNSIIPVNTIVGYGGTARIGPDVIQVMAAGNQNYVTLTPANASISGFSPALGTNFSGNALAFQASIPITGWSSNVQMSDSAALNVVDFVGAVSAQSLTANVTNIAATTVKDSNGAWTGSTYVVPVAGDYGIGINAYSTAVGMTLGVYINTSFNCYISTTQASAPGGGYQILTNLKAGDSVSIRAGSNVTIATDAGQRISIMRISGPSAIAATETVAARYTNISANNIANGATPTIIFGWTKDYDTHGFFNLTTGVGIIPISGKYTINGRILYSTQTFSGGGVPYLSLNKNGSEVSRLAAIGIGTTASYYISLNGSDTLNFNAGDTFSISTGHGESTPRSLFNSPAYNFINITRVGN